MALALLGLAACGGEDDEPMVMPASGTWTYPDEGLGENTCGTRSRSWTRRVIRASWL